MVGFLGILLLAGVFSDDDNSTIAAAVSEQAASAPAPKAVKPSDPTPGITRVGVAKAKQMWRDVPSTPGMQRWSCEGGLCSVRFNPTMWAQMTYDLKRNATAMLGIAFAQGQRAEWTEVLDMMTNRRLARYSTKHDDVDID